MTHKKPNTKQESQKTILMKEMAIPMRADMLYPLR
jgi:hypothetical protein